VLEVLTHKILHTGSTKDSEISELLIVLRDRVRELSLLENAKKEGSNLFGNTPSFCHQSSFQVYFGLF
jgi:hypothetical protein